MRLVRRFRALAPERRRLVLEAARRLAAAVILFRARPAAAMRALQTAEVLAPPTGTAPEDIAWAVRVAGRRIPGGSCLPKAMVARRMLARAGVPSEVRIGTVFAAGGALEAHAWVVAEGGVLVGDMPDLDRFVPLSDAGGPAQPA